MLAPLSISAMQFHRILIVKLRWLAPTTLIDCGGGGWGWGWGWGARSEKPSHKVRSLGGLGFLWKTS